MTLSALLVSTAAFSSEGWTDSQSSAIKASVYFLAVALAAFGGTKAQSGAASVALEGIARNPSAADKIMTPMILALALMESLVIFTLISVFLA
jgi:F-type H+-transporting ATPase subunit c